MHTTPLDAACDRLCIAGLHPVTLVTKDLKHEGSKQGQVEEEEECCVHRNSYRAGLIMST